MRKERSSEERIDLIVGIVTVVVILALFGWLLLSLGRRASSHLANASGQITALGETRRGSEQVFTFELDKDDVLEGSNVTWTVNGECVYQGTYAAGEAVELAYTPQETGKLSIVAMVGRYYQTATVDVLGPQLTVTVPDITVVYGDTLPEINYTVSGFVEGEDADFCYDGSCITMADRLDVGVYDICLDKDCCYLDYETQYQCGKLTVLPRQLYLENEICKVYDGTNTVKNPELRLSNVVKGDEVCAQTDLLYFDNKNVGCDKMIMLGNVQLVGENACNYVLPDFVCGEIAPKQIDVVGLTVKSKAYDGTTKATIDKMGSLSGVCAGDSVAIGSISVSFEDAGVGEQRIIANGVTLIGADKNNYVVRSIETHKAAIDDASTFWDKLLDKEPLAMGNVKTSLYCIAK